jgi:hypothetical protein
MFSNLVKALFGKQESRAAAGQSDDSAHPESALKTDGAFSGVIVPRRIPTELECKVSPDLRADIQVINPSRDDVRGASVLPQGTLVAIWTEFRAKDGKSVEAYFIGRDSHYHAPYVLLRAKHSSLYLFEQVKSYVEGFPGVTGRPSNTIGSDNVSVVIHFPREQGFLGGWSDKKQFQRVMEAIALPPDGADTVEITRLSLRSVKVGQIAGTDRLGDRPYEMRLLGSGVNITVSRGALPQAT